MKEDIKAKIDYFDVLKNKRTKWESIWGDIRTYVVPQEKIKNEIFDSTARWAREQLASGLQSLLVNSSIAWFNISVANNFSNNFDNEEDVTNTPEVKLWCQDIENSILKVFNNPSSNFYSQIHEFFLTLTAFGSSVFYVEEDLDVAGGVFFRNINLDECYFEDNRFGLIDTMYRKFSMSIKSAAAKWDDPVFKEKLKKSPDAFIDILHIVTKDEKTQKSQTKNSKFTSEYINLETQKVLSSSDYDYFPFLVTRWVKESEAYGYSPAHHILPDIKVLNTLRKMSLESGQKQLRPPMLVPKDGFFLPLKTSPSSVNFYRNGIADRIIPLLDVGSKMSTLDEEAQCRDAILKAFYIDIFRMQKENKEMTATEVSVRTEEQMRMMSPIIGRIETEFLNPLIINVYKILAKYGSIPILQIDNKSTEVQVEYISPLSRSQKSASITSIEQVLGFFQRSGITNIYPEVYDNIDWDKAFRLSFDLRGAPQCVLKTEEEVASIRKQRQQMLQTQQMMAINNKQ